jgi:hypothetical protein
MSAANKWMASARVSLDELEKEVKRLREELALYRQGLIDATLMYPDLYNFLPLYLRELIE